MSQSQIWKRIEPTIPSKVGYRHVVTKTFIQPSGALVHYETTEWEGRHFAGVIALTPDNQVIIARQFRPGPERLMDEIPGGGVDDEDGADYEAAARRELREESGYEAGAMELLGTVYKDSCSNGTWHFYLATDCTLHPDGQQLDDTEHVEVRLIGIDQLLHNARNAQMTDVEAVFLAYEQLQERLRSAEAATS